MPSSGPAPHDVYEFGPFRLEPREARLLRDGNPIALTPKVLELLVVLVSHAGQVVTYEELMDAIWPDVLVSEGNLKQNVWVLRKALGGDDGAEVFVETVPRVGYRFAGNVKRLGSHDGGPAVAAIPVPLAPLVGRGAEVDAALARLGSPAVRLLTLTGPGGTGKTRLALEAARRAASLFADGAAFVPLAPVADAGLVVPTVAKALAVEEDLFRPLEELVGEALRTRRLLLVLDNFEHVLTAAAPLARVLAAAPGVKALVTSRAPLRVSGEHEMPVPPLAVPVPGGPATPAALLECPSVALFVERAAARQDGFVLDAGNARVIAEICVRLEGLPLAIELAAARIRFTPPERLLAQLDRRLDVLTAGPRDVDARQRTLRDTIAWSDNLLPEAERALFHRVSVFAGGFAEDAAAAVTGADGALAERLEALVDASLLRLETRGAPRFSMLETIRELASERLAAEGLEEETRARHAAAFAERAARLGAGIASAGQREALAELEREHDNLRAALRFLESRDPEAHLALAALLGPFWHLKGHWQEALDRLRQALALAPGAPAPIRATALLHLGRLHFFLGAETEARSELEEGLALARRTSDPGLVARLLEAVAQARQKIGEDAAAREALDEALPLALEAGDDDALAEVLTTLGAAHAGAGEHAAAREALERGLALGRGHANGPLVARALYSLAGLALLAGDTAAVARYAEQSRRHAAETGDTSWSSHVAQMRGRALAAEGREDDASELVGGSLVALQDVGSHACLPHGLEAAARLLLARRGAAADARGAVRLLGAAERTCERLGVAMLPVERALFAQTVAAARAALPAEAFAHAWSEGRDLGSEAAYRHAAKVCGALTGI